MTQEKWTAIDEYIAQRLLPKDEVMEEALKASDKAGLHPIAVAPNQGKFLHLLAKVHAAHRILEIGTLGGYSTLWLARALPPHGNLISLEIDPKAAEVARANIARADLSRSVEVRVGPALESLARLEAEKVTHFDMVFIDADKETYPQYLAWALKLTRIGGLILFDNMVRKGEITNAVSEDPRVQGTQKVYEMLAQEPRVSATALQTVGVKGHDGFVMALVVA